MITTNSGRLQRKRFCFFQNANITPQQKIWQSVMDLSFTTVDIAVVRFSENPLTYNAKFFIKSSL